MHGELGGSTLRFLYKRKHKKEGNETHRKVKKEKKKPRILWPPEKEE